MMVLMFIYNELYDLCTGSIDFRKYNNSFSTYSIGRET